MAIRKLIADFGGKILPSRDPPAVAQRRQPCIDASTLRDGNPPCHYLAGVDARDSGRALRRYLETRREFAPPSNLEVFFDERTGTVLLAGTVADATVLDQILRAASNVHGVMRIDNRLGCAN